jgi:hypothetical protein
MAIEFRIDTDGVAADLVSYARGIYRLERRDWHPKICDLATICERDTLSAVVSDSSHLGRSRAARRDARELPHARLLLRSSRIPRRPGLPADDQPVRAQALLTEPFD